MGNYFRNRCKYIHVPKAIAPLMGQALSFVDDVVSSTIPKIVTHHRLDKIGRGILVKEKGREI